MEAEAALGRTGCVMVVPTYNERDNLAWIVGRLRVARTPTVDVLVVDDGSPDGTGELADELAAADPQVTVLHRTEKAGLGAAYLHGFRVALERGYDVVGEMDADGSHQPEQLPPLLAALRDADLVIGSRWVPGGSVVNWPLSRKVLSRRRQPLRPAAARHPGARRDRRLPAVPSYDAGGDRPGQRRVGRLHLPDRPGVPHACAPGCGSSRCRSSSSSGSAGESKMSRDVATESLRRITAWGLRERRRQVARRTLEGTDAAVASAPTGR